MDEKTFRLVLAMQVPEILRIYGVGDQNEERAEIVDFYHSRVYALMSEQATGVWSLSPYLLADLYRQEKEGIDFDIPEGIS